MTERNQTADFQKVSFLGANFDSIGDPRILFAAICAAPALQALVLAGAKVTPPTRSRGEHLTSPLLSQWAIADVDGWVLRVHKFHRDDPDVPHNHAWQWWSLVLEQGYFDISCDGTRVWRAPGDLIVETGDRFHKVVLDGGRPAWTLFLHGPDQRAWGFSTEEGKMVPRDEFVSVLRMANAE